jgi:probable phosphoglycerate mutase
MNHPTQICIVRHGETDWNAAGILQGWTDIPINDKGWQQAEILAQQFADLGISGVYASPLIRAFATAEFIAERLGLPPPRSHEGLKERCFGVIQGIPKSELSELNPALCQKILTRNPACDFEQGESMDEFADRIMDALVDVAKQNRGGRLLIVTHGWVLDVVTRHVRGLPRSAILPFKRRNGDCLWVEVTGGEIRHSALEAAVA